MDCIQASPGALFYCALFNRLKRVPLLPDCRIPKSNPHFCDSYFITKGNQSDQLTRVRGQFCNMSASKDSTKPDAGPAHIGKGIKFLFGGTAG